MSPASVFAAFTAVSVDENVRGFDPMIYGSKIQRANISAGWFQGRRIFVPDDDYPVSHARRIQCAVPAGRSLA